MKHINYLEYQGLCQNKLACDSEDAECFSAVAYGVLSTLSNEKEVLNRVLATLEPDQIICYSTRLCKQVHAGISLIRGGKNPIIIRRQCYPFLLLDEGLGEALKMAQEYLDGRC
jgi:hypothetical protein